MSEVKKCSEWPLLTPEELKDQLKRIPMWQKYDDAGINKLRRKFVAKGFTPALDFLGKAGAVAEEIGHHPDFHLTGYRNVEIVVFTHSLSGLTELDIKLCCEIDQQKVSYSPKFLKENPECAESAL